MSRPGVRPRSRRHSRRRSPRVHPLAITALMLGALVAVTFYAFNQALPFGHSFTVSATVANSVNVRAGDPVRIAGIDVGAVSGVAPAGQSTRITFTLDPEGLPIHRNATLAIRDRLFLEGSYYLALDPGTPRAPILADGGSIPQSQTTSPVQFFEVLSTFDVAARANLKTLVAALAHGFGRSSGQPLSSSGAAGLRSTAPALKPALADTAVVSRALRGTHPGDVERLLSSASQVTGTLGASSPQLARLVTSLNVSARALVASDGALGRSISGLDRTLTVAPPALGAVDRSLPGVDALARVLDPSLRVAPPLVTGLSAAVAQLSSVLAPVQRGHLLLALRTTFRTLPTVLTQLGRAFPITKQVSDCLRTHVTPLLKQTIPDGSLSSGRPVWQDFVHFLPGVGGASANFDANGPYTRVLAAAGNNTLSGGGSGGLLGGLLGGLVSTAPPGGGSLLGARPAWVGDMTSADFRPEVPCATQAVPSLTARTAAVAMHTTRSPWAPRLTRAQVVAASRRGRGRGR
ncbi:MAG: MlaD family protein [Actinomycetota bacterium]|nr:MlaD family protein [Actinomycetota bacterium]